MDGTGNPVAPARVVLTRGLSTRYTNGVTEFHIQATNMRGVVLAMDKLYPGIGDHLEEDTTVAIDGEIHETLAYSHPVKPGAEIFFIPKLEGG